VGRLIMGDNKGTTLFRVVEVIVVPINNLAR